jgi:voltage-gated potassium channel Kch
VEPSVLEDKNDHIVVCGLQGVGLRVVEQFYLSGTDVVVVDDDADIRFARILEGWGIAHIRRSAYIGEGLV